MHLPVAARDPSALSDYADIAVRLRERLEERYRDDIEPGPGTKDSRHLGTDFDFVLIDGTFVYGTMKTARLSVDR
ncbi:unnamed protein product [Notodromas monacha]|uniref:Uncharacterized protein n=1 Tax=Notodromas monacha TaxID=399045 RepID=A0A7R9BUR8_9CRUS|nr:unnamed protein product [Notodromas monacha]CAG0920507.1 unnamed protein product [Notodromas monacha]